jgi:hypothetical protein
MLFKKLIALIKGDSEDPETASTKPDARIASILEQLAQPATQFHTGGFRPTNSIEESWIGKVTAFGPDEEIPLDEKGRPMLPLFQLHVPDLPYIHPLLKETFLLTVFMSEDFPEEFEPMGKNWLIREYASPTDFVVKDLTNPDSWLKPFPLKPELLAEDYPLWDGGGVPSDIEDEVLKLEEEGVIDDYYDIIQHSHLHKVGGYPSYCQSGVEFNDGFEFVFQVSTDNKAHLNVVDSGSFMFAKNGTTGEWELYYDFC